MSFPNACFNFNIRFAKGLYPRFELLRFFGKNAIKIIKIPTTMLKGCCIPAKETPKPINPKIAPKVV